MATYQVSGPRGAVYQIQGPDGADPSAIVGALHGQAAAAPAGGILRDIALAGRDVGEGVFDTLAIPHDLSVGLSNLISRGSNRFLGTHRAMLPTFSGALSNALTQAGAPVPTTPNEQLAASAIRGTAGALTGVGLLGALGGPAATAPNILRGGAAGLTGGTSAGLAQHAGIGPVGQFFAGLAGGFAPSALEASLSLPGAIIRPLTRGGQAQLAGNSLVGAAVNPAQAAASLDTAAPLVPGSMRTAGEASGDTGLLALEKGVRARNPGPFGERISQQNAARQAQLTALGGTPADIQLAQQARDAATAPMREGAFATGMGVVPAPVQSVHDTIDSILASPAGSRESIAKTMKWASGLIGDESDPAALYEVRKDLALAQRGKLQPTGPDAPNASTLAQTRGQLGQVISSLDDAIEAAAPGYQSYLAKYAEMSQPINMRRAIQALQQRASSGLDTATGEPFLSGSQFSRNLDSLLARPTAPNFTPDALARLNAVREDLARGNALSSPTVKAPGSDTFSNFALGRRLTGGAAGHLPVVGKYLRGLNDFVDQRVNAQLAQAMLDPAYAAKLLRQGISYQPLARRMTGTVGRGALPATLGGLMGVGGINASPLFSR